MREGRSFHCVRASLAHLDCVYDTTACGCDSSIIGSRRRIEVWDVEFGFGFGEDGVWSFAFLPDAQLTI